MELTTKASEPTTNAQLSYEIWKLFQNKNSKSWKIKQHQQQQQKRTGKEMKASKARPTIVLRGETYTENNISSVIIINCALYFCAHFQR